MEEFAHGEGEGDAADEDTSAKEQASHEDAVFMRSYIPRTLNEVYDPERDVEVLKSGGGRDLIYKDAVGLVLPEEGKEKQATKGKESKTVSFEEGEASTSKSADAAASTPAKAEEEDDGASEDASEDEDEESGEEKEGDDLKERKPRGHRHEDKEAKKVRAECMFRSAR